MKWAHRKFSDSELCVKTLRIGDGVREKYLVQAMSLTNVLASPWYCKDSSWKSKETKEGGGILIGVQEQLCDRMQ